MVEITNHNEFFMLQKRMENVPFTQSEAWYDMLVSKGLRIRFFINSLDNYVIAVWGFEEKIPFFNKKIFRVQGEALRKVIEEKVIRTFYKSIKDKYEAIEIDSNNKYNIEYEIDLQHIKY
jgi:hypothetical protein